MYTENNEHSCSFFKIILLVICDLMFTNKVWNLCLLSSGPTVLPEDHTEILSILRYNTETGSNVTSTYATKITEGSFYVTASPLATETSMAPTEVTTDMVQKMSTPPNSEDFQTTTNATAAPEPLVTTPPPPTVVETEGPAETEQSIVTGVAQSETGEEVVVEGDVAGEECVGWKLGWCKFCQFEVRCCFWLVWWINSADLFCNAKTSFKGHM